MPELNVSYMILEMHLVMFIKAKLLSTYCLNLYRSQLWNFSSIDDQSFICSMAQIYKASMEFAVSNHDNSLHSAHDTIICDVCLARDNHYHELPHLPSYTEIVMLIEHVCTTQHFPFLV